MSRLASGSDACAWLVSRMAWVMLWSLSSSMALTFMTGSNKQRREVAFALMIGVVLLSHLAGGPVTDPFSMLDMRRVLAEWGFLDQEYVKTSRFIVV